LGPRSKGSQQTELRDIGVRKLDTPFHKDGAWLAGKRGRKQKPGETGTLEKVSPLGTGPSSKSRDDDSTRDAEVGAGRETHQVQQIGRVMEEKFGKRFKSEKSPSQKKKPPEKKKQEKVSRTAATVQGEKQVKRADTHTTECPKQRGPELIGVGERP